MNTTLYQIQCLEKYLNKQNTIDNVLSSTISKLYAREIDKVKQLINQLSVELQSFESKYSMSSNIFDNNYKAGLLGDDIDFVEWSATIDMMENAKKSLKLLQE